MYYIIPRAGGLIWAVPVMPQDFSFYIFKILFSAYCSSCAVLCVVPEQRMTQEKMIPSHPSCFSKSS